MTNLRDSLYESFPDPHKKIEELGEQLDNVNAQVVDKATERWIDSAKYATLQDALNDASVKGMYKVIVPKNVYNVTSSITIPEGVAVDFNGSTLKAPQNIAVSLLVLDGNDITVENVKLLQTGYNYNAVGDSNGVSVQKAKNVTNIKLKNIETTGFNNGINVYPADGYRATKVRVENCVTTYAEMAGINISNAQDVSVLNHHSTYNGLDGLKVTKNTKDLRVQGGYFSYNVHPTDVYADGIDLYGGGSNCIVSGAVCENNGGVGIHILSGELQDAAYQNPVWEPIKNILIEGCICRNNVVSGMDVVTKTSVSATSPYPTKVLFRGCVSHDNGEYGVNVKARHVTFSDCSFYNNKKHGMLLVSCIYSTINNCQFIKNETVSAGVYAGIKMEGCKYINVDGGIITGSDADYMQQEDGSALTVYHLYGIWLDNCDFIFIDVPTIVNFTSGRGVYVTGFNLVENATKTIVVKLGDIGTKPLNNQIGYFGSTLYKNGRRYIKNTNLNSVAWDMELRTLYGSQNVTADGTATSFTIAHGLGAVPVKFNAIPKTVNATAPRAVTADATNITITYTSAPASGTLSFQWEASS
jgi:parallel beta-helix repeat protein